MDLTVTGTAAHRPGNARKGPIGRFANIVERASSVLDFASPALDLVVRLWTANVFFKAGLTKIASWDSTVSLFENVYEVPVLPPELAALLGTGVELGFPVLLALGLGGRFAALVLFVFNIIAVISYPDLSETGLQDHVYWGLLLAITVFHGSGKLSVDHLLRRRFTA
jgi:putative oxidoreductase